MYAKEYFHPFNPAPLQGKPLVIVGPSGVGKLTLIDFVLAEYGTLFDIKRSHTTRSKRQIEKAINKHIFVTEEEFKKMQANNEFEESRFKDGAWHGTSKAEIKRIQAAGKIPIIEVDFEGAVELNKNALEANFLFIYPPTFEELRKRIGSRIETEKEFKLRIKEAIRQIQEANKSVLFTNRLINDTKDQIKREMFTLIEALYFQEIKHMRDAKQQGVATENK